MTTDHLEKIVIRLPRALRDQTRLLSELLGSTVVTTDGGIDVKPSNKTFAPTVSLRCDSGEDFAKADFLLTSSETVSVYVKDITGVVRQNPSPYHPLPVSELRDRLINNGVEIHGIDHVGFNLPWFGSGIHPAVADLRRRLNRHCLYHQFPTGEPWDFILPGDPHEIDGSSPVDYAKVRKPKFEIVSFDKCSTPLVQIDVTVDIPYVEFSSWFPEALNDVSMKNIWVYLETMCNLDICLVINERSPKDWCTFFSGHRIT